MSLIGRYLFLMNDAGNRVYRASHDLFDPDGDLESAKRMRQEINLAIDGLKEARDVLERIRTEPEDASASAHPFARSIRREG